MSEAVAAYEPLPVAVEQALVEGDLSKLSVEHRIIFYQAKCKSLGLNPLSKPFAYLNLNGKLVLYALKDCKEQLRKIHKVSLEIISQGRVDELYVVHVRARTADGRVDEDSGFAVLGTLKGEALGNAMLKAITKAKSRVTLSICGLGIVDETEVDSIPGAVVVAEPTVVASPFVSSIGATATEAVQPARIAPSVASPVSNTQTSSTAGPKPQTGGTHERMSRAQVIQALKACFTRLCGDNQRHAQDLCMRVFGAGITRWQAVEQLPLSALRAGLARLEPLQSDEPPAVDVPDFNPPEEETPAPFVASGGEEVEAAGPTEVQNDHEGGRTNEAAIPTSEVDGPAAPEWTEDGYATAQSAHRLEAWALLQGQEACFVELTKATGMRRITAGTWARIVNAVQYRASHPEGANDGAYASGQKG